MTQLHCCKELADALGKGNAYPKPAYISPENWQHSGHLGWWYPGADGPGYYIIHELDEMIDLPTPKGIITVPMLEYRRMESCPYCDDKKRRPVGRPPSQRVTVSIHLSLYPEQIEYLSQIGNGNISHGARLMVDAHRKRAEH